MVHGNGYNSFHCKQIRKNSTYTNRQKRQPRYMGYNLYHIDIKSFKIMYLATVKLGLEGEPGIGKTRMLQELTASAGNYDVQVLWGRCYEGEGAPHLRVLTA